MPDLRIAFRALSRSPGFTLVAVLTLALGIGSNTAIFSVVYAVLLRPLPYPDADRLVRLSLQPRAGTRNAGEVSYSQWADLRREVEVLEGLAGYATSSGKMIVEVGGELESLRGHIVTGNLPDVLGIRPLLGRVWENSDDRPGAAPTLLLSEGLWRGRFGGNPDVLGSRLRVDGVPHEVVGVLPAGTAFPAGADVWRPLAASLPRELLASPAAYINMVGRLGPGAEARAAQGELDRIADRVINASLPRGAHVRAELTPFAEELFGSTRGVLVLLLGAAGLVLLVACANVANLQLVRGVGRGQELAVRRSLGARPRHLVRVALAESLLLGAAGAVAGVATARLTLGAIAAANPVVLYRADTIGIDGSALGLSLTAALITVLGFGLVPVGQALRLRLASALHGAARTTLGPAGARLMDAFVIGQVALALVLSVAAGLLLRSLDRLHQVPTGFDEASVLTLSVPLFEERYQDADAARAYFEKLIERTEAIPGVTSAAAVLLRPLDSTEGFDAVVTVEGQTAEQQMGNPMLNYEVATPGYFATMGIPVTSGRDFDARDGSEAPPVAIVGAATAARLWPRIDAVGARLKLGLPETEGPWIEVVGVVGDVRSRGLETGRLEMYVPSRQSAWTPRHLVVRANGDPGALVPPLRTLMLELDPMVEPVEVFTTGALVDRALARPRFQSLLLGLFAALGVVIGSVGLYGVMAYSLALRTREMGIRLAFGATPGGLLALGLRRGLRLAAIGIAAGLVLALGAGRALEGQLYEVGPADPLALGGAEMAFLIVAAAASLAPAWSASRADPATALRAE